MALSDILQKIVDDAQLESDRIISVAKKDAEHIQADMRLKSEQKNNLLQKEAENKKMALHRKADNILSHQEKDILLNKKREILSMVFERAKKEIKILPPPKKEAFLIALFLKIDTKTGTVFPQKGEEKLVEAAMKKAKKNFPFGEAMEMGGGFRFVSESVEIDFGFANLVDEHLVKTWEQELSRTLFS